MKEQNKLQSRNIKKFDFESKIKRPNSYKPNIMNNSKTKLNKVIHINLFQIPIENINKELKDIRKQINQTENTKPKKDKILIKNANIKVVKEKMIMSLRKDLNFQKLFYKNLLKYKEYANKNCNFYKKNYDDICKYKVQLHEDLSDFVNIVNHYEELKTNYDKDKELMIKTNENIIFYKQEEQNKMKDRLDKLNHDTQNQKNIIEQLTITLDEYNKEYNECLENDESEFEKSYEILLDKYKELENEYEYYFDLELRNRKNKLDEKNENLFNEEKGMVLLKLSEKKVKGEFLKKIIRDIKIQIQEIEQLNKKINDFKDMEKLLGKRGAEKYKQKMKEKYKNKISNINKNYTCTY